MRSPTPEQEALFNEQRLAVLATVRKNGSPQLTPVNYVYSDGRFLISVTRDRAKYHNIRRNPLVSLCVMGPEGRPYVTVYGRAEIEETDIVEATMAIFKRISEGPPPANFEEGLRQQRRVLVRVSPERLVP